MTNDDLEQIRLIVREAVAPLLGRNICSGRS